MTNSLNFYAYNLTSVEHNYKYKHLCTAKNRQMQMRVGFVVKGSATFVHHNEKLSVKEGDIIFIPEKIFCYSEWTGTPEIRVIYLNFKLNIENTLSNYNLQTFYWNNEETQKEVQTEITKIHTLLQNEFQLEAYSLFYLLLAKLLPILNANRNLYKKELCEAMDYIASNWDKDFLFADVAAFCCSCQSKLYHLFKEQLCQTPIDYLNTIKINYALKYLETGKNTISEVAFKTNFHSETYFRNVFKKLVGCNPSEYVKKINKI